MTTRALTVLMPFHSPFYAPLAVAVSRGHFREEGLDVTVTSAAAYGRSTAEAVADGHVQIVVSGIMRSLVLADEGGPRLVHFAEVCSRNGFFLLAREPRPDFRFADLADRTVISFAEAPTPWQCMLTVLRRHGVDPARVRIERSRPVPEAVAAFRAGHGDFLEQTQPVVEGLLDEGAAHLVASMGEATGPVPFSSYMASPAFLASEPDVVTRFTRAAHRTQRWMASHGAAEVAEAVAPTFPEILAPRLVRIVERFLRQATWPRDPVISREGYEYLQQMLLDGGLIRRGQRYEDIVDTTFASAVVREGGAA